MMNIKPEIIRDEQNQPIAVRIAYEDWRFIESKLDVMDSLIKPSRGIEELRGSLDKSSMDPLEFQRSIRSEWQ